MISSKIRSPLRINPGVSKDLIQSVGDFSFQFDIPGPYKLEWSVRTAEERVTHVQAHPIPIVTGAAFVAAPYVTGGLIMAFAPPPFKPLGALMLVPNPVADALYFSLGYSVGVQIEEMFM